MSFQGMPRRNSQGRHSSGNSSPLLPISMDFRGGEERRYRLNVGGTMFETTGHTLNNLGSQVLRQMMKEIHPKDGVYFIDRDPDSFRLLLNVARYGEVYVTANQRPHVKVVLSDLEHYKVNHEIKQKVQLWTGDLLMCAKCSEGKFCNRH